MKGRGMSKMQRDSLSTITVVYSYRKELCSRQYAKVHLACGLTMRRARAYGGHEKRLLAFRCAPGGDV